MEPKLLIILLLTTFLLSQVSSSTPNAQQNKYSTFIKTSCNSTTYPTACVKSLLPYATTVKTNPVRLVTVALSTTLKSANATLSTITKLSKTKQITKWEAAVLKDCIGDIKDSMDEIKSSIKEISGISKSANKQFAISNAQTWTSSAITDENSCLDGFSDRRTINPVIKQKIRNSIVNLARVYSSSTWSTKKKTVLHGIVALTCWRIWKARNEKIFKDVRRNAVEIVSEIKALGFLWFSSRFKKGVMGWKDWQDFNVDVM